MLRLAHGVVRGGQRHRHALLRDIEMRWLLALLLIVAAAAAAAAGLPPCTAGATSCSSDTANATTVVATINDPTTQARFLLLWDSQCQGVYSEAGGTTGHQQRVNVCQAIAAGRFSGAQLVSLTLNSTLNNQILAGAGVGGNLVDADIVTSIGAVLTVSDAAASTTATGTAGQNYFTVASAAGIVKGATVSGVGVPYSATVLQVTGTTVLITQWLSAALAATPVNFDLLAGFPTRAW